jgi:hypothetical protein
MPKVTDPDLLNQNLEVTFITGSKIIKVTPTGSITASLGVSMQALYSFCKEEWRNDNNLIKFPFPMLAITSEQFELINDWDLSGSIYMGPSASKSLMRDAGWSRKNAAGNSIEEHMNITSLGTFNTGSDRAYYLQSASLGYAPTSSIYSAEVNEPVLIYASASSNYFGGAVRNHRDFYKMYLRSGSETYGIYDLNTEQNIPTLTYRKYALPLSNDSDPKLTISDNTIATTSPYTGSTSMSIQYFTSSFTESIGGNDRYFKIRINGNQGTAEQIYNFVQYQLRKTTDIDTESNYSIIRGDTAEPLVQFIGDTLRTLRANVNGTASGVYIDDFQSADTNRIEFTDDGGTIRTYPYVAAGTLQFNDNLQNDPSASYFTFFTNDDAGDNTGRDFGTQNAIIMNKNNGQPITGSVATSASLAFDYDYDNNVQRGNASSGSDAPYTAVALGLNTAQYVVTTGTITRSTSNLISFVAALERNYSNT